ncbi:MAG: ATP-binding protein [Promicromonosporaceae bacterium]|nr:ATP-binding protein [Promicromonosporaceae bacterium]
MESLDWPLIAAAVAFLSGLVLTVVISRHRRRRWARQAALPAAASTLALGNELRVVLSRLDAAVMVLDDRDRILGASPPAYGLRLIRDGFLDNGPVRLLASDARYDGQEKVSDIKWKAKGTGLSKQLVLRATPLGADHVLLQVDDQTEAKRVEDIRRDFVANVSHELKTPVGALSLLAETIAGAADDAGAVARFAEMMQAEAARLTTLVQEIIELSRVQANAGPTERLVPIALAVAEAVDHLQTAADAKEIALVVQQPTESMVRGDLDQLVMAVRNVIHNAISYSEPHTTVSVAVVERDGDVLVTVADQGIGIPAAAQARIFERFYRVDPARSRLTGGTGLGLSIVKNIVSELGGLIEIWSQPKVGTTVTLRLPLPSKDAQ